MDFSTKSSPFTFTVGAPLRVVVGVVLSTLFCPGRLGSFAGPPKLPLDVHAKGTAQVFVRVPTSSVKTSIMFFLLC